jgi:predicted RNase H-like nuclease (RuvC/YqgF family)
MKEELPIEKVVLPRKDESERETRSNTVPMSMEQTISMSIARNSESAKKVTEYSKENDSLKQKLYVMQQTELNLNKRVDNLSSD